MHRYLPNLSNLALGTREDSTGGAVPDEHAQATHQDKAAKGPPPETQTVLLSNVDLLQAVWKELKEPKDMEAFTETIPIVLRKSMCTTIKATCRIVKATRELGFGPAYENRNVTKTTDYVASSRLKTYERKNCYENGRKY